jgi:hypothetical protein
MVLATEHIERIHQAHEVLHAKVSAWDSGWCIVIECDCGERFVLSDAKTAGARSAHHTTTAKEGFYSWLEGAQVDLLCSRRGPSTQRASAL